MTNKSLILITSSRGVATGVYRYIYPPKSVTVLFTCGTHVLKLQWLGKTSPPSNSWLRHYHQWDYTQNLLRCYKNLAIANRSRVSCAHNSSTASPWPWNLRWGSLKVTGNGTIGQIIHDLLLLLDELLDVEYYRDLEMWVRGHSRSLKVVPFERLGTVS